AGRRSGESPLPSAWSSATTIACASCAGTGKQVAHFGHLINIPAGHGVLICKVAAHDGHGMLATAMENDAHGREKLKTEYRSQNNTISPAMATRFRSRFILSSDFCLFPHSSTMSSNSVTATTSARTISTLLRLRLMPLMHESAT